MDILNRKEACSPSLCVLAVYLGKLPDTFPIYLKSCEFNQTVDFKVITDDRTPFAYPGNVRPVYVSYSEVRERLQAVVPFDVSLPCAYKICDFRPLFGAAFRDLTEGSDYWAHSDMDLVYGNIRASLGKAFQSGFDKVLGFGHLSFYRTALDIPAVLQEKVQIGGTRSLEARRRLGSLANRHLSRYLRSVSQFREDARSPIQQVLQDGSYRHFDEWNVGHYGVNDFMLDAGYRLFDDRPFTNIHIPKWHFENSPLTTLAGEAGKVFVVEFDNGRLFEVAVRDGELIRREVLYVHVQKRPVEIEFSGCVPHRFHLVPNRYTCIVDALSVDGLRPHLKKRWFYGHYFRFKLKNLVGKVFID